MAHASLRFGLGRFNTPAEVEYVADRVVENVHRLRQVSPLYDLTGPTGRKAGPGKTQDPARM
jgi:hypothetical protein